MDKLRIDSGIKTIEVNDKEECISIPVSDVSFYQRYADLLKNFAEKQEEVDRRTKELSEKHKDKPDDDIDAIVDSISLFSEVCRYTCGEIDRLFGEGCCRKVFVGIENPSVELIGEFFDKITPLIHQYADERNQKINLMYNRNRKGARNK